MQITLGLTLQNNNGNKTDIFFVIYCTNILLYSTYAAKFWLLLTGGGERRLTRVPVLDAGFEEHRPRSMTSWLKERGAVIKSTVRWKSERLESCLAKETTFIKKFPFPKPSLCSLPPQ